MRPIWKGAISFGLVNIPINLMSAEEPSDLKFSMMDSKDHAKIKYQRVNADTGKEVAWEDIVFARAHANDFSRIAVVTHSQWVAWSAWLAQIFVRAEMRIFDDEMEARSWLTDESEGDLA